jgi:hypothetical protein
MLAVKSISAVEAFNARAVREHWQTQCDERLVFDEPKLAALRDIWKAVSGSREMPRREDFTARILGRYLQHLSFVERTGESGGRSYRFRLFGSALARYIGDSTGKYLEEVVPAMFITSWLATYDLAIETRRPLRFVSRFRAAELEHVQAECLVAPLAGENAAPSGLLVSVIYSPVVV